MEDVGTCLQDALHKIESKRGARTYRTGGTYTSKKERRQMQEGSRNKRKKIKEKNEGRGKRERRRMKKGAGGKVKQVEGDGNEWKRNREAKHEEKISWWGEPRDRDLFISRRA